MANHFPDVPSNYVLASINYSLNFGDNPPPMSLGGMPYGVISQIWGALAGVGSSGGVQLTFTTPGSFGTFDQDSFEQGLEQMVALIYNLMSALSGQTPAQLEANTKVTREWSWTGPSGSTATFSDTMPFGLLQQ